MKYLNGEIKHFSLFRATEYEMLNYVISGCQPFLKKQYFEEEKAVALTSIEVPEGPTHEVWLTPSPVYEI